MNRLMRTVLQEWTSRCAQFVMRQFSAVHRW
jgi:hypothetical protein